MILSHELDRRKPADGLPKPAGRADIHSRISISTAWRPHEPAPLEVIVAERTTFGRHQKGEW